jgi:hypothetical protein
MNFASKGKHDGANYLFQVSGTKKARVSRPGFPDFFLDRMIY